MTSINVASRDSSRSATSAPARESGSADGDEARRHVDVHRLQGLRGGLPGVERSAAGNDGAEGTYQTLPEMTENFWNLIRFSEHEDDEGGLHWLMRKDQCMHCTEPGCLVACPAPGAIVQYTNGIVDFQQDQCIGCGYCMTGCPFNVPKFSQKTRRVYKCTLCVDRSRSACSRRA